MREVREYKLKFYLNAKHYILHEDVVGEIHPHTWEISLHFSIPNSKFVEFSTIEKDVNAYLSKYQNLVINEVEPFDSIIPTLENMTDYFLIDFSKIIEKYQGILFTTEISETPTRTYIARMRYSTQLEGMHTLLASSVVERILSDEEK